MTDELIHECQQCGSMFDLNDGETDDAIDHILEDCNDE